jgi:hypothetical protein
MYVHFPHRVDYSDGQHETSSFFLSVHGDGTLEPFIPPTPDISPMQNAIEAFLRQVSFAAIPTRRLISW